MFKSLKIPAVVAIVAACSLSVPTTQARGKQDTDAAPTLITVGKPGDPKYANAGDNLRTGVGSIFIEFDSIAEGGFICTASAISPTHILTAAHCVRNTTEEDQADTVRRVRFIAAGLADAPILEAMSFSVHPLYDFLYPLAGAFAGGAGGAWRCVDCAGGVPCFCLGLTLLCVVAVLYRLGQVGSWSCWRSF